MDLASCTCRICMYVLVEPVTMPCGHEVCLKCFKDTIQFTSLNCPMCRLRISSWCRRMNNKKELVNSTRWDHIRQTFPEEIQRRLNGVENDESSQEYKFVHHLAEPGEIRKEYEQELQKMHERWLEERRLEQEAGEKLAKELYEEELQIHNRTQRLLSKSMKADEELARQVAKNEDLALCKSKRFSSPLPSNKSAFLEFSPASCSDHSMYDSAGNDPACNKVSSVKQTTSQHVFLGDDCHSARALMKANSSVVSETRVVRNVPCTVTNTDAEGENMTKNIKIEHLYDNSLKDNKIKRVTESNPTSMRCGSSNSIDKELTHFKPIVACPRTPPKVLPNGIALIPKLVKSHPRNLSTTLLVDVEDKLKPEKNLGSPVMARHLRELVNERKTFVEGNSKFTATVTSDCSVKLQRDLGHTANRLKERRRRGDRGFVEIPTENERNDARSSVVSMGGRSSSAVHGLSRRARVLNRGYAKSEHLKCPCGVANEPRRLRSRNSKLVAEGPSEDSRHAAMNSRLENAQENNAELHPAAKKCSKRRPRRDTQLKLLDNFSLIDRCGTFNSIGRNRRRAKSNSVPVSQTCRRDVSGSHSSSVSLPIAPPKASHIIDDYTFAQNLQKRLDWLDRFRLTEDPDYPLRNKKRKCPSS